MRYVHLFRGAGAFPALSRFLAAAAVLFLASCASTGPTQTESPLTPAGPALSAPAKQGTPPEPAGKDETADPSRSGPLEITVEKSIVLALQNNPALRVESFNPVIVQTAEDEARAAFDPTLSAIYARSREKIDSPFIENEKIGETAGSLGISGRLPTGTDVDIGVSTERTWSDLYSDDLHESRVGITVTQALLQGAGLGYNLAQLRRARLDTAASRYELRGFTEALVARVEETYWDYALMQRQIEIYLESLKLAQQQKSETEEMVRVGSLAESELIAAEAEIALRREGLINARSNMEKTRLVLLSLLNPSGEELWHRPVVLLRQPAMPEVTLDDADAHVNVAMRMRPDLSQARLQVQSGDIELVRTGNGLLPRLDFFITLGKTGYADSFRGSWKNLDHDSYDAGAGLSLALPLVNRQAGAEHRHAQLARDQAEEALKNVAHLVQVDVRSAHIEVLRAKEQVAATAATRALQEEKARIEKEKFRVGKSTGILVAQAQRDLLSSRISEIQAVTNYLKSLISLYRLEGSLLERRGIRLEETGKGPALPPS